MNTRPPSPSKLTVLAMAYFSMALLLSIATNSYAGETTLPLSSQQAIGKHLQVLIEKDEPLQAQDLNQPRYQKLWSNAKQDVLSFGINANPVWLKLSLNNPADSPLKQRLVIENSWLDRVDIFLFTGEGNNNTQMTAGDELAFTERPTRHRFFVFDLELPSGPSSIAIRVQSIDPMILPIYLMPPGDHEQRSLVQSYSYGILYGAVLALLLYNFMLFLGLKDKRYLYFAFYIGSFLFANIAYTGHGYRWLWYDYPDWQQFLLPLFMMLFNISGLMFAMQFLQTKTHLPRIHRATVVVCFVVASLQLYFVTSNDQQNSLVLSFCLMLMFSSMMLLLGVLSLRPGNRAARLFLSASIAGALGSTITACSVLGFVPFNTFTYRATDVGMALDIVLLAFALADQFRANERAKLQAELTARIDPLTQLNNRRAFYEQVEPLWQLGARQQQPMSVILFDIDHFKSINDNHGHTAGDSVLVQISSALNMGVRASDITGRWGGEEFIIFLPDTDLIGASSLASKVREIISSDHYSIDGKIITVTASFGVAQNKDPDNSLDTVISTADKHLYVAKHNGRDCIHSA